MALILIFTGCLLRGLAYRQLGRDFTFRLKEPRRLHTKGIYRFARHPSYLGSILIILGFSLLDEFFGIALLTWAFFHARIVEEEQIIEKSFKARYQRYKTKTAMFFPKLFWSKRKCY